MFLLYSLSLGAHIWPIGFGGPRVLPVRAHSSYATVHLQCFKIEIHDFQGDHEGDYEPVR
jgi:hypothetical protein